MFGFIRKHFHRHIRQNIHQIWLQWVIRIYEGFKTFLHGAVWFTGLLFLASHVAASAVQAGYHITNAWSNAGKIYALDLSRAGWQELLALASIPAGIMGLYSMYTAYERWRAWAFHGHHLDPALSAPEEGLQQT